MARVSGISKGFVIVGFKVADPTMLFTNPTTRVVRRRVAASGYQGGWTNPTPLVASKSA
jgi:hypothetical protein